MSELSPELMAACQQVKVSDAFMDWLRGESLLLMTDVALLAMAEAEVEQNIIVASGIHFPRIADKVAVRKLWILARACMKDGEAANTDRSQETASSDEAVMVTIVPSVGSSFEKRRFELNVGEDKAIRFGRSPKENDFALDLPGVSWRHAVVKLWPDGISPNGSVLGIRDLSTNGCGLKLPNERDVRRLTRNKDESLPHGSVIMCPLKVKTAESDLDKVRACFAVYVGDNGGMPMKPPEQPSMSSSQKILPMLPAPEVEPDTPAIESSVAFSKAPPETPVQTVPVKTAPPAANSKRKPLPPPRVGDSSAAAAENGETKPPLGEKHAEEMQELDAILARQLRERKEIEEANRIKEQEKKEIEEANRKKEQERKEIEEANRKKEQKAQEDAARQKELDDRLAQQLQERKELEEANRQKEQKAREDKKAEETMARCKAFAGQKEQERFVSVNEHQASSKPTLLTALMADSSMASQAPEPVSSENMSESPTSVDMSVASAEAADVVQKKEEESDKMPPSDTAQKKEEERRIHEEPLTRKQQERKDKEEADRKNAAEADQKNAEKTKADKAAEMMARCMAFARQQEQERRTGIKEQEVQGPPTVKVLSEAEKKEEDMRKREEFLAQRRQQRREKEEANRQADEKRAQARASAAKEEEARQREAVMARKKQEEKDREIEEMHRREKSISRRLKDRKATEEAEKEKEKAKAKQHAEDILARAKAFARQQEQEGPTSIKKERLAGIRIERISPPATPAPPAGGVWTIPDDEDKRKKQRKDRSDSRSRKHSKRSPSVKDKSAPPAGGVWTIPDDEDKRKKHRKDRSRSRSRSRKRKRSCSRKRKRSRTHDSPPMYMPVGEEEDKRKKHKSDRSRSRRRRRPSGSYDAAEPSRSERKGSCSRGKDYGDERQDYDYKSKDHGHKRAKSKDYYDEAKPSRSERSRDYGNERSTTKDYDYKSKDYGDEAQDPDYRSKDHGKERSTTKDYDYKTKDYGDERQDYDYRSKDYGNERPVTKDYDYKSKDYGNDRQDYDYRSRDYGNERSTPNYYDEAKPSSVEKKRSPSRGKDSGKEAPRVIPKDYGDGNNRSKALKAKDYGNTAFQAQRFDESIQHYSAAIRFDPTDAVFFSNRSGAHASLKHYTEALKDAEECVRLRPDWWKAYSRRGTAEFHLERLADAERTFTRGLGLQPEEQSLKDGLAQVRLAKAIGPKGAR